MATKDKDKLSAAQQYYCFDALKMLQKSLHQ